ncbi:ATP-binding protein [Streptomyces sp. A1277]|uniref:AAA family ATPase n=1 Tax=Streptomyces sp. A1277 TaxID=2563103 RepID=UPI0010A2814B|nr:AAA family ATPase [Streptomyces sp. A1277]THA35054.1 ATP-binding protein [Streptomyces sp. A1277]
MSTADRPAPFEGDDRQYSPTRLPGWLQEVNGSDRIQPRQLTRAQLAGLSPRGLLVDNDGREVWHANLGPIDTPQLLALHADLREIVESNRQDGSKTKPAALVDAHPGLGKSTAVRAYGCDLFKRQVNLRGDTTAAGARRVPVIYIALSGNTQIRGLNAAICRFYGLPVKGDADTLAERAVDAVLSLKTVAMIIDDIHFLAGNKSNSIRMANQLKYLSNVFPVTLIYVGVGVQERGILHEGFSPRESPLAQFGRRTTALTLLPFQVDDDEGRLQWHQLLKTVEQKLVLAEKYPGMLAEDLSDYLFARSTGHFASLMALINRGCLRAIRSGHERLDTELMNQVKNDAAAEEARRELQAAITAGLLTTRPTRQAGRRRSA